MISKRQTTTPAPSRQLVSPPPPHLTRHQELLAGMGSDAVSIQTIVAPSPIHHYQAWSPPVSARRLQEAMVGSTLMYGPKITWRGQRGMEEGFQKTPNRMGMATLGVLPSTPIASLEAEGSSMPVRARLDRRQEGFAARLC